MAILLIIIIYMIISFSATGGDGFAWIMLVGFIIAFAGVKWLTKEDMAEKDLEFERKFDEYKRQNNIK